MVETARNRTRRAVPQGGQLKYQQVKNYVLKQIADGHLKPGDALPPERTLAKTFGWGVHTIRHALGELNQEKIVQSIQGKGTFVKREQQTGNRKKLDLFALIVPETRVGLYPSLLYGFENAAGELHHQTLICNTDNDVSEQGNVILQLVNKNVAGVAIVPPTTSPMPAYQLGILESHRIPVVFCHRRPEGFAAPLITWPYEEVGSQGCEEIIGRGHRRVAFVAAGPCMLADTYLSGLRKVLKQNGLDLPEHRTLYNQRVTDLGPPAEDDVHRALAKMLEAPDRPTAVFCSDITPAERVFLEATRLGLRVPEDLSIVGFGCVWREGALSQRLCAVTVDERELGRQAASLIEQMRIGQQPLGNGHRVLVPLGFSEGRSIGAVPGELRLAKDNCASLS